VTIGTNLELGEAYVAKAKLETAGIWAFIADEVYYGVMPWGVRLQVKESQAKEAIKLLERPAKQQQ